VIFSAHRSDRDSERSHPPSSFAVKPSGGLILDPVEVKSPFSLISAAYSTLPWRPFSRESTDSPDEDGVQRESGIFIPLKWSQSSNTLQVLRRVNMLVTKRKSCWKNLLRSCDLSALDTRNICLLFRPRCNKQRWTGPCSKSNRSQV
jgi:hypothetical protein